MHKMRNYQCVTFARLALCFVLLALVAFVTLYAVKRHFFDGVRSLTVAEKAQEATHQLLDGHTLETLECTYFNYDPKCTVQQLRLAPGKCGQFIGVFRDLLKSEAPSSGPYDRLSKIAVAPYTAVVDFHSAPSLDSNQGNRYVIWIDDFSVGQRNAVSLGFIRLVVFRSGGHDFIIIKEMELNSDVLRRIKDAVKEAAILVQRPLASDEAEEGTPPKGHE